METNKCDINECLLVGLKKHAPQAHSPAPLTSSCADYNEYDIRLNNLLRAHLSNQNLSNKEIAEASKCAAIRASEIAEAKRAVAEQKAAQAAEAMAAAMSALKLVATIEDEADKKDKRLKENEMKKHAHVRELLEIAEAKRAVAEQKAAKAAEAMAAAKTALELAATIEDEAAKKDERLKKNKMKKHVHVQEARACSKKEEIVDEPLIDSSVIEGKGTRKATCLDVKEKEEQKVCEEEDKKISEVGVDERKTSERENDSEFASTSGVKEGEVEEVRVDLEKMTLGEWLDFLEVYLPKQIVDETEEMITEMRREADRVHEFVLQKKKKKKKNATRKG